jgi:hypothetical protein
LKTETQRPEVLKREMDSLDKIIDDTNDQIKRNEINLGAVVESNNSICNAMMEEKKELMTHSKEAQSV